MAAILMPDHLHVVVAPSERDGRLGNFSAALKRWMRKDLNASWEWQPGCFDRLLRSDESLHEKWLYIQENPVRAGLVRQWKDWRTGSSSMRNNNCRAGASPAKPRVPNSHQRLASDAFALQSVHLPR